MNANEKKEVYKELAESNGRYIVSNYGNVICMKPHNFKEPFEVKKTVGKNGYLRVSITIKGKRRTVLVHQLVARMFIPNPNFYTEVNHIDGDKANNYADNLEWCTRSHNVKHAFDTGLKVNKRGSESCHARKCYQYDMQGNFIREWGSIIEAASYYNDVTGNVSAACSGKYKTFHGYIWSYKKEEIDVNAHRNATGEKTYQYTKDGQLVAEHFNMDDAVAMSGVDKSNITKCCLGKRKTAGGFIWSHTPLVFNKE